MKSLAARALEALDALAAPFATKHPDLYRKAMTAWQFGDLYRPEEDEQSTIFYCRSRSQKNRTYTVKANSCNCPATGLCYHRIARRLALRFEKLCAEIAQQDEAARQAAPKPVCQTPKPTTIKRSMRSLETRLQQKARERPKGASLH